MTQKKILVADDEKDIVELVAFNLEREGFAVLRAYDGNKAWEMVNKEKPDLVILDPPRTGAGEAVSPIAAFRPKRIVYVSCDPPTLARDLRLLSERGYTLHAAVLVDLFPQTYHMEVIALLKSPC